ncbi:MAG: hypothetical protein QMC96_12745 [Methanomicrobiales archaeon]|nr:hypothetical protein [Methanomicrobiales archaeon]
MKDRWLIILVAVVVVVIAVRPFLLSDKPEVDYDDRELYLPSEPYNPHIVQLLEIMMDEMQFDNASAIFRRLSMDIDPNGTITSIHLDVYAKNMSEQWGYYRAYVDAHSQIFLSSQPIDLVRPGRHPYDIAINVDQIPFPSILSGNQDKRVFISTHADNKEYQNTYGNIYVLKDGVIVPIEKIAFTNNVTWYSIEIAPYYKPNSNASIPSPSDGSALACEENPECTIIFTQSDLAMATAVEYA